MDFSSINLVSVILTLAFIIPIISGMAAILTRDTMRNSFNSLLDSVELIAGILISVYITKRIFFIEDGSLFKNIYNIIPEKVKDLMHGRDILVYMIFVPLILLVVASLLRLITMPIYRYILQPMSDKLFAVLSSSGILFRRIISGLWNIPKALVFTLIAAFIINFSMYYLYSPKLSTWTTESKEYQLIYKNVLYPVLNSNIAKQIPVLVRKEASIVYFNGVLLEDGIKSNTQIDDMAKKIVGKTTNDNKKAYLLYKWICKNIKYDYSKAENIIEQSQKANSGAIIAFETRKGICFDYSCLYVAMCRAVGLKVRLYTGIGYSGSAWGDHSWNQVYCKEEKRWINVDTTFGSTGANYFDKNDFNMDHRSAEMQGEW